MCGCAGNETYSHKQIGARIAEGLGEWTQCVMKENTAAQVWDFVPVCVNVRNDSYDALGHCK